MINQRVRRECRPPPTRTTVTTHYLINVTGAISWLHTTISMHLHVA